MYEYTVILKLRLPYQARPESWDWHDMLDMSPNEEVEVALAERAVRKPVRYRSNNSGGDWWLSDEDWKNLEAAGWEVDWEEKRWLNALATSARRYGLSLDEAVAEWERIVGQDPEEQGCSCCGQPHSFYYEED